MTQKNSKDGKQYKRPDDYVIETELGNRKIRCEIKYISNQKAKYIIFWNENNAESNVYSEKSATGAVTEFLRVCKFKKLIIICYINKYYNNFKIYYLENES